MLAEWGRGGEDLGFQLLFGRPHARVWGMSKRQQVFIRWLVLGLLLASALPAAAFDLFPKRDNAGVRNLRLADGLMTRADAAYEAGDAAEAHKLYSEALERYEELLKSEPNLHDGLPQFRVEYCREQLARVERMPGAVIAPAAPAPERTPVRKRSLRLFGRGRSSGEKMESSAGVVMSEPAPPELSAVQAPPSGDVSSVPAANAAQGVTPPAGEAVGAMVPGIVDDAVAEAAVPEPEPEPPDPAVIAADLREAGKLLADEQLADATRLLVGVLRADPGNRSARLMIALVRARQGRYDEALVALEDLSGKNEDLPLLLALSAAYCGAERFFDAMLVLDKAIKLAPADPRAYLNLAWLHLAMDAGETGRRDAEAYYRRAIRLGARRDRALEVKLGLE